MSGFVYNGTVDFSDTDAGGIAHFTSFLRWVERAEGLWMASLGVKQFDRHADGSFSGFPRVDVKCRYKQSLLPGEAFAIRILPEKVGRSSLTYRFEILKGGADGAPAADGSVTVVHVTAQSGGAGFKSQPLPDQMTALSSEV